MGSMGRRQLCTYMYGVKSSSGVVTVAHGVRRGMGYFVPFPSMYKRRSVVEDLRGGCAVNRSNVDSV